MTMRNALLLVFLAAALAILFYHRIVLNGRTPVREQAEESPAEVKPDQRAPQAFQGSKALTKAKHPGAFEPVSARQGRQVGDENPVEVKAPEQASEEGRAAEQTANVNIESPSERIEATIIDPFRKCVVAAEVDGIIENVFFDTGDFIEEGQLVAEISRKRYELAVAKMEKRVQSLKETVRIAEKDLEIKERVYQMQVGTLQEVEKGRSELAAARAQLGEAEIDLKQALLNLESCKVTAPFSGFMAARFKNPHEAVNRLENLFAMVDTARVYAVANVPLKMVDMFRIGQSAVFNFESGARISGRVERVEKVVDSRTDTKKVYVLIDNSKAGLEVGMTGYLEPGE